MQASLHTGEPPEQPLHRPVSSAPRNKQQLPEARGNPGSEPANDSAA